MQRTHHVFSIDLEEVFAVTQECENYGDGRMKLKGLARFDDCSAYGIAAEAHKELVRKEIRKLADTSTREGPYLFDSKGLLLKGSLADFEDAESILDQIFCNFAIITHDNVQIGMWNTNGRLLEDAIKLFKKSRETLLSRFGGDNDTVEGGEPVILEPPERNRTLYNALLDYILGCVGRLVLRSATSRRWVKYSLAVLALWAVKLKLAAYEPSRYAKQSISNGEDVVDRLAEMHGSKRLVFLKVHVKNRDGNGDDEEKEQQHDTLSTNTSLKTFYYETQLFFRCHLERLVQYSIDSILDVNNLQKGINSASFEACALVYKAGLEGILTAVNQDRFGSVTFSSVPMVISNLYSGMLLLRSNVEAIQSRNRDFIESGRAQSKSVAATVKWYWPEKRGKVDELRDQTTLLYSMDDILSVAILQGLATLYGAHRMMSMIRMVSSGSTQNDPTLPFSPPPKSFQAMFHIISEDCSMSHRQAKLQQLKDDDVQFISSSPLRHGIRGMSFLAIQITLKKILFRKVLTSNLAGTNLMDVDKAGATSKAEERARQILMEYKTQKQKMDTWIVSEESITIRCRVYVITVISIALMVVCGSLAIPFVVQNAIRGVDPFQFATFAWVTMGFFLIIAKSRYVSEWPWHHFLHGKIVCKSVSDVRDVSGINDQMIIMNLLHGERENILITRGPFNGMFSRKSDGSSGFSIDQPVKLSTMLASGFIVLKVANEAGEHLICGDVRKGTEVGQFHTDETDKYLAYKGLDTDAGDAEPDVESSSQDFNDNRVAQKETRERGQDRKVFLLKKEEFWFKKVVGIYVRDSLFG